MQESARRLTEMFMFLVGQIILTVVLVGTPVAVLGFQWNKTHLFHPDWHPHAKFHLIQLMVVVIVLSVAGVWLLWRGSVEPEVGTIVAMLIPLAVWGGEFVALLGPGTHPAPNPDKPNTFTLPGGVTVYGNLFFSGLLIVLSVAGYLLTLGG
jgi:hypothetical protein